MDCMRWCDALSRRPWLEDATDEVVAKVQDKLQDEPDLVLAFWTHSGPAHPLAHKLEVAFPGATRVGAAARGVLAEGQEVEGQPALAVLAGRSESGNFRALAGHLRVGDESVPDAVMEQAQRLLAWSTDQGPSTLVVLADPFSCPVEGVLHALDLADPLAEKIGGLASGGLAATEHSLLLQNELLSSGAVILRVNGPPVESVVAQGCRPIGEPAVVTRCEGPVVHELSRGRPIDIVQQLYTSCSPADQALFEHSLFVGIEMKDQREYRSGDFLIRNLLGLDRRTGGMVVGADVHQFQALQFHLRDADASRTELQNALAQRRSAPGAALLFTCLGRGAGLYGAPHVESGIIRSALGGLPLAGFFCNGEIGRVGDRTYLHGYTATTGLFYSEESGT